MPGLAADPAMTNMVADMPASARRGSANIMASARPSSKVSITALGGSGAPPANASATWAAVTAFIPAAFSVARCSPKRAGEMTKPPSPSEAEPMPW